MPPVAAVNAGGQHGPSNFDKRTTLSSKGSKAIQLTWSSSQDGRHDGRKYVRASTMYRNEHFADNILAVGCIIGFIFGTKGDIAD